MKGKLARVIDFWLYIRHADPRDKDGKQYSLKETKLWHGDLVTVLEETASEYVLVYSQRAGTKGYVKRQSIDFI